MSNKLKEFILLVAAVFVIVYALAAFITLSWNPAEWTALARCSYVLVGLWFSLLAYIQVYV